MTTFTSTPSLPIDPITESLGESATLPASTTRLPDFDGFSMIGDIEPGMLPLLVCMPDGNREQVDVPVNSTVDDIRAALQRHAPETSMDALRLSFGNSDLDPSASLLDTNIVDAYGHASTLLHAIGSGAQNPETKAAALDTACAVVESISNGIKDMEALCEIAGNAENFTSLVNNQGDQMPKSPMPHEDLTDAVGESAAPETTTPSALIHSLSRRMPNLFNADFAEKMLPQDTQQAPQPSISSIREARRKARAAAADSMDELPDTEDLSLMNDDDIGISTFNHALPTDLGAESLRREPTNLVLAHPGRTTWLGDVMTTFEVDTVRRSGVLEKSKDGQAVNQYLIDLEAASSPETNANLDPSSESQSYMRETETVDDDDVDSSHDDGDAVIGVGDSSDESDAHNEHSPAVHISETQPQCSTIPAFQSGDEMVSQPHESAISPNGFSTPVSANSEVTQRTAPNIEIIPQASQQMPIPRRHPVLPGEMELAMVANSMPSPGIKSAAVFTNEKLPPATSVSSQAPTNAESTPRQDKPVRCATRIAPKPTIHRPPVPLVPNGTFPASLTTFQGCPPPPGTWSRPTRISKRGRKRKNPELSENERALMRKEQNRESARLSRVRRKVITAEYEGKLNELISENTQLRKQVENLNNRLEYLQNILTVTVRPEPQRQ